ncbi:hypothetical protein KKA47_00285 [bacterium]|nr:hypothetical protein [bacterium]
MSIKSKYSIFERVNIDNLYNTFLGMTPREQTIAIVIAVGLLILFIVMPVSLASNKLNSMEKIIAQSHSKMDQIMVQIDDFNRVKAEVERIESSLKGGFDRTISTTMENLAEQSNIKENVQSLKEKPIVPTDLYDELSVDVSLSKVPLDQLIDYLYNIEQNKTKVLKVKKIQLKPRYDNKRLFDASFSVSTYRLTEE